MAAYLSITCTLSPKYRTWLFLCMCLLGLQATECRVLALLWNKPRQPQQRAPRSSPPIHRPLALCCPKGLSFNFNAHGSPNYESHIHNTQVWLNLWVQSLQLQRASSVKSSPCSQNLRLKCRENQRLLKCRAEQLRLFPCLDVNTLIRGLAYPRSSGLFILPARAQL